MRYGIPTLLIAIVLVAFDAPARPQQNEASDPWAPFQFLLGSWSGAGSGKPGEAIAGETSFSFDLGKNVIVRKNRAEYAPKRGEDVGFVHEDMMIIYPQPGGAQFHAMYFDNEGHVISYVVSFPSKSHVAVFESDASDAAPRFRLVYSLGAGGEIGIEFSIASPGGEFKIYTTGTVKRAG